jgi:general secretion pathway protein L
MRKRTDITGGSSAGNRLTLVSSRLNGFLFRATVPKAGAPSLEPELATLILNPGVSTTHLANGPRSVRAFLLLADIAVGAIESAFGWKGSSRRWIVREIEAALEVLRIRRGEVEVVARLNVDSEAHSFSWLRELASADTVELRLDPEKIVSQRFSLPVESRSFAGQIIEHRLERLTPWKAEDVLYGYAVRTEANRNDLIEIDFVSTSRNIVNKTVRQLAHFGITPTAIGSSSEPNTEPLTVNILTNATHRQTRRRKILRRFCIAVLPFAAGIYLGSLILLSQAQIDFDMTSAALDQQQRAVQARTANSDHRPAEASFLAAKTLDQASFALIDRLAKTVPDNTFLTDVEISPLLVRLKGRSADAPALVPLLESEAGLQDVQFESPVIREASGGDRFDIVAKRQNVGVATGTLTP